MSVARGPAPRPRAPPCWGPRAGHVGVRVRCRPARAAAAKMASMRESDTGLWLHNKLGATDELWAPPSIASLLTAAVIDNIRLCFHRLSSAVKLKLLLGTLHLPRRTVDEVRARAGLSPSRAHILSPARTCAAPSLYPAGRARLRGGAAGPPPSARRLSASSRWAAVGDRGWWAQGRNSPQPGWPGAEYWTLPARSLLWVGALSNFASDC
ncbi:uncharacterized protein LOC118591857 [Onychomys torridus]|uniref:uncharacterized protein LOC118591857 n=1 Tax=Onychomys torridus TaxID=38674 RepID=UPI00167F4662|nr:uncharacterized protein LOC118591857 [Onychomys torridus]